MGHYTKFFLDGRVESFDGRIYTISLSNGQKAILKYSTVHQSCRFPVSMLSDGHLSEGTIVKLCRIVKDDKVSILPDHRYYYADDSDVSDPDQDLAEIVREVITLLTKALKMIKN